MRPAIFAHAGREPQPGAWALIGRGCLRGGIGLALAVLAWVVWHRGRPPLSDDVACVLATVLLLPGLSLMLHFGIFNLLAGLWRFAGVDARSLFRAPLAARSLGDFWGRRWNLGFTEMTALGIYRPLSGSLGRKTATVAAFLASGLLHELAISVPVLAGFGLPLSYFLLHGTLVLIERRLESIDKAVNDWGWWAHVWVLGWLAVPMPILFHRPFLRGVVWPLIGMDGQ
jgi:alginate O-acetyltransferase complex protein AlgI